MSKNITIIGAQWGDEGKGKIVDYLSKQVDVVVRFQGGHNAGHTLVIDNQVYKLSLLPSGVMRPGKLCIIGNGVVLNPWALLEEIGRLRAQGVLISPANLLIAENACLILAPHWQIDQAREIAKGASKIGTTGRGIGPAYEDKVARRAIRVCDLLDPALLETKITQLLNHHNLFLRAYGLAELELQKLLQDLHEITPQISPYVFPHARIGDKLRNKRVIFEGAQGVMLDIDFGTYPFVSSSNSLSAQAVIDSEIIGVAKAYTTRVGSGPFPTRETSVLGELIGQRGRELGTVTGRRRACGWFDVVQMRHAVEVSGIQSLFMTKIDVLDTLAEIPVCVGYRLGDQRLDYFPTGQQDQASVTPIYENLPGWQSPTYGLRHWEKLPELAKAYIAKLEHWVGVPVRGISTSPEREDTILR